MQALPQNFTYAIRAEALPMSTPNTIVDCVAVSPEGFICTLPIDSAVMISSSFWGFFMVVASQRYAVEKQTQRPLLDPYGSLDREQHHSLKGSHSRLEYREENTRVPSD